MKKNRICELFGIEKPIIQGGMVWCSGWRLASAVSNSGGLGLLGAGSMHPETLVEHIHKMNEATSKPWGINVPLMYPEIDRLMDIIIDEGVKIVFTSAGSPKKFTARLHEAGIKVAHVVSSSLFARKCEDAGVDAIVAEGFEAGGHNGREETTTFTLIPQVRKATSLPLIAAGGIGSGQAILAAEVLGADADTLRAIMGKAASKRGIFEGDVENGEIEIGQIASAIKSIDTVADIFARLDQEYNERLSKIETYARKD